MNTQFENFITTFKNISKSKNRDIQKAYFFTLDSIKNHDIMNFNPKQQIIINKLKNYYKRATKKNQIELNDLITQYYIDKDDEINEDEINEDEVDENEVDDEEEQEVGIEQNLLIDKKNGI